MQLEGDRGAKTLLEEHRQQLVTLACDEAACDIDTIEDLNDLQSRTT
jgi:CTP:molybdopterin cytidylyltransferase MocA